VPCLLAGTKGGSAQHGIKAMEDFIYPEADVPLVHLQRGKCPVCGEDNLILRPDGKPFSKHRKTLKHLLAVKKASSCQK
jgi:hypothetical protein